MARTRARFIPRLETFDDRSLPSVSVTPLAGGGVDIQSDDAADQITIVDNGTADPGAVTVVVDGEVVWSSVGPIGLIFVTANGGDDVVDYRLEGPLLMDRFVNVDLGTGRDWFTAHMNSQTIAAGVELTIGSVGRRGGDHLTLNAWGLNVGVGGSLAVDFQGGAGKDFVVFNYSEGQVDGTVSLLADQRK